MYSSLSIQISILVLCSLIYKIQNNLQNARATFGGDSFQYLALKDYIDKIREESIENRNKDSSTEFLKNKAQSNIELAYRPKTPVRHKEGNK